MRRAVSPWVKPRSSFSFGSACTRSLESLKSRGTVGRHYVKQYIVACFLSDVSLPSMFVLCGQCACLPRRIQMVEETLVAFCAPLGALLPNEDRAPLPRYASLQHSSSMADLLDRVVRSLLRSPSTTQVWEVAVSILLQGALVSFLVRLLYNPDFVNNTQENTKHSPSYTFPSWFSRQRRECKRRAMRL